MPKHRCHCLFINGLRVAVNNTTASVARIMPSNRKFVHPLGAGFENRVKLGAVLDDFPRASEPAGNQEALAGGEFPASALEIFKRHPATGQAAELRLRISNAPLAARARPDAGVKLLC